MLFFEIIFEFNLGIAFSENLLEAINNLNNLGFIKFRTDPNDKTGYLIHENSFSLESIRIFRYTFKNGGRQDFFDNLLN